MQTVLCLRRLPVNTTVPKIPKSISNLNQNYDLLTQTWFPPFAFRHVLPAFPLGSIKSWGIQC